MILLVYSEGPDQTARMRSLIWAFTSTHDGKAHFRSYIYMEKEEIFYLDTTLTWRCVKEPCSVTLETGFIDLLEELIIFLMLLFKCMLSLCFHSTLSFKTKFEFYHEESVPISYADNIAQISLHICTVWSGNSLSIYILNSDPSEHRYDLLLQTV